MTLDRTQQSEVTRFNNLFKDYKELMLFDIPKKPRTADGKILNIDDEMKDFQKNFRQKELKLKIGNKVKNEFKPMDIKDLYKLTQKEV
jgi:hypothetical protein